MQLVVRSSSRPYAIAMGAVAVAMLVRALLDPMLGAELPFYLFYFAVLVASLWGGLGPGLAALSVSFAAAVYFFVVPRFSFTMGTTEDVSGAFRFVTLGIMLVLGGNWARSLRTRWSLEVRERQRAEEAARKAQEDAVSTLASIGDGLITVDTRGCVTFMNPIAEQLSGWDVGTARGRNVADVLKLVHGTGREPLPHPALRSLQEQRIVTLPEGTLLITRNGDERPIDDSAAPIRDAEGRITGAVVVFREMAGKSAPVAFAIAAVELYPAPGSHLHLSSKELGRLELACRDWIGREWRLDPHASRIVGLAGYSVTIQQGSMETLPSGAVSVRFLAAYSR